MAVASHFIDILDGEFHLIPSNAKNIVILVEGSGSCKISHSPNKETIQELDTLCKKGVTEIENTLTHFIKASSIKGSPKSIKLYYGV